MRHIAALEPEKVPRDSEFKFKDRAQALVNKWHTTISTIGSGKANGTHETDVQATDADKSTIVEAVVATAVDGDSAAMAVEAISLADKKELNGTLEADLTAGDITMSEAA